MSENRLGNDNIEQRHCLKRQHAMTGALAALPVTAAMRPHDGARARARKVPTEHTNAGNAPPYRAGRWCAGHGLGRKPFWVTGLDFHEIFSGDSVDDSNGARDDENASRRAGGYCAARAVSRDRMTYSGCHPLGDSHGDVFGVAVDGPRTLRMA